MPLKLFYITNDMAVAAVAQDAGVDAVFVDLETIGKKERQGHRDTVISDHNIADVSRLRKILTSSSLLVRINPIYPGTSREINAVIAAGADIIMLPMFTSVREVDTFLTLVAGRAETCLLLETPGAVDRLADILTLSGIDSVHIGLNDLHLAYGRRFMFELLADGTVERLTRAIGDRGIRYGFGGIACIGSGLLPAEYIIAEHYRLGSSQVILSRSFCDCAGAPHDLLPILFQTGIADIRDVEGQVARYNARQYQDNMDKIIGRVAAITLQTVA